MELELECANKVMLAQVLRLLRRVITIVDLNFELLILLEVELHLDLLDPGGVGCVMDHLRLAELLPHTSSLLVKHSEGVRLRHSVELGQVLAPDVELEGLSKATSTKVGGSKHGGIDITA